MLQQDSKNITVSYNAEVKHYKYWSTTTCEYRIRTEKNVDCYIYFVLNYNCIIKVM